MLTRDRVFLLSVSGSHLKLMSGHYTEAYLAFLEASDLCVVCDPECFLTVKEWPVYDLLEERGRMEAAYMAVALMDCLESQYGAKV